MKKIIAMTLLILIMPIFSGFLFAHEHRKAGAYEWIVGFLNEPAFSGQMNGIDLRVSSGGQPVEGLENTLQAAVESPDGKNIMTLRVRKRYNKPGQYAAYFLPTQPGRYSFQIEGEIQGQPVDETFTSGPTTFHDVEDSSAFRFP